MAEGGARTQSSSLHSRGTSAADGRDIIVEAVGENHLMEKLKDINKVKEENLQRPLCSAGYGGNSILHAPL